MFDLIKKTMLAGIGVAALTKDKVEQLAKDFIEKGEMTEKEGKELVDEFLKKSEQAKKDLESKLEDMVQKVLKKMNIATKEDIAGMEARLKTLEQSAKDTGKATTPQ